MPLGGRAGGERRGASTTLSPFFKKKIKLGLMGNVVPCPVVGTVKLPGLFTFLIKGLVAVVTPFNQG